MRDAGCRFVEGLVGAAAACRQTKSRSRGRPCAPPCRPGKRSSRVDRAAAKVEELAVRNAAFRTRVAEVANRIIAAGRLENYGTPHAQTYLRKWAREFGENEPEKKQPKLPSESDRRRTTLAPDNRMQIAGIFVLSLLILPSSAIAEPIDFDSQIVPILSRAGCNAAACHGGAAGQAGFRLSLFGGDADLDYRMIVREIAGRRVNLADPQESLLLAKPTGLLDHGGGDVLEGEGEHARTLLRWIAEAPAD